MRWSGFGLSLIAACSGTGSGNEETDAPPGSEGDAKVEQFGPVEIVLRRDGVPRPDKRILFQARDSSVVADVMTDALGAALAPQMPADGFVTIVDQYGNNWLQTFAGVQPGDRFVVDVEVQAPLHDATVTLPPSTLQNPVYTFITSCPRANVGVTASPSVGVTTSCSDPVRLSGLALTGVPGQIHEWFTATVTLQGTVDLSSGSYTLATTSSYSISGLPPNVELLSIERSLPDGTRVIANSAQLEGGGPTQWAVGMPDWNGASDFLRIGPPSSGFGNEILAWGPSPLPSVDFANQMPAVTVQPFDDASHTIQYQVTSGATPNFIVGEFFTSSGTWVIVAPHRSEGLVFPRMPAGTLKVVPDDGIIQFGVVTGGYDTIRTNYPFGRNSLTREYDEMYRAGAFPAQGSLIVSNAVVDP